MTLETRDGARRTAPGLLLALVLISACGRAQEVSSGPAADTEPVGVARLTSAPQPPEIKQRSGTDWPWFLGPTHDNVSTETGLLAKWPQEGPPVVWEQDVGTGYSAPSVLGERLVLHHRIGDEEIVECRHAVTGERAWQYKYPSDFVDPYGYNNGPRCSPVLAGDHCYTLGAKGVLACLKLDDGSLVWKRELLQDFKIPDGFFGVGATPILEGDNLIVLVGGQPNSGVVAFDAATGKTLWESVGRSTWDGAETGWAGESNYAWTGEEMVVSYSSPIAATIHGKRHLLCLMRQGLVSVDPETGAENFHYWFMSRTYESVNAARPLVVDDTILLGAAYRVGAVRLRVNPDGKGVTKLWENSRLLATHWSTSLYHDGCYFGFSGRHENEGTLQCVDAESGELKWETPGWDRFDDLAQGANGEITDKRTGQVIPWPLYGRGSKILADGKFIILAERGTLALVEANKDEWKEISRCAGHRMHYPSWTAPVLSRGYLYLRCEDALVCLDLKSRDME